MSDHTEKKKPILYAEAAYVIGLILTMIGIAFTAKSDLGVSMVAAPSYLLHLKFPAISFGVAQYLVQGTILIIMCVIIRSFRISFLFSFVTAFIGGCVLDVVSIPINALPGGGLMIRVPYFVIGMVITAWGIALMFRTYISQEVHELFVKQAAKKFGMKDHNLKLIYDCTCLCIAFIMMVLFFGIWPPVGIGIGTLCMAFINGPLIGKFGQMLDRIFEKGDLLPLRRFFSEQE